MSIRAEQRIAALENKAVRMHKRVATLEKLVTFLMTGKVEIQGVMHLMECDKRNDEKNACTCGSVPVRSAARSKGKGDRG